MCIRDSYINIRVSVLPTVFGEKAVLRLLASNSPIDYPDTFGMEESDYQKIQRMLCSPNGIIYFTGPTGSGKTTTLYMILQDIAKKAVNISTIEDPVETVSYTHLLLGGGYGIYLLASGKKGRKEQFAFGPFLCAGMILGLLFGNQMIDWYLGILI